jgi:ABC-2 type transport system permease protein
VYAIGRGSATIAGEEEAGTLDLLLAQPIGRTQVYVTKAVAVALGAGILALATWLPIQVLGPLFEVTIPWWNVVAVTINLFLITVMFASLAMAAAAGIGRRLIGASVAAAFAFLTYLLDGFGQSVDWLEGARPLTPWYWYDPTAALADGDVLPGALVLAAATIVIAAVGLVMFRRRSLSA